MERSWIPDLKPFDILIKGFHVGLESFFLGNMSPQSNEIMDIYDTSGGAEQSM